MIHRKIGRRGLLLGAGALSATAIVARLSGARLFQAQEFETYDLIDLGPFEIDVTSGPTTLWGAGSVSSVNEIGDLSGSIGVSASQHAPVVWSAAGERRELEIGEFGGLAHDLNDAGVVVGRQYFTGSFYHHRPVMWRDGDQIELPLLSDSLAGSANLINNNGVIVGVNTAGGSDVTVRWIDGAIEQLFDPNGNKTFFTGGINDAGSIVANGFSGGDRIVLWRGNDVTFLPSPEDDQLDISTRLSARGINNNDQALVSVNSWHYYYVTDGNSVARIVDRQADGIELAATDLNDAGDVVGFFYQEGRSQTAFIERSGEIRELATLIPDAGGLQFTTPTAINNAGMIAGTGVDGDGLRHGILLVPVA